MNAEGMMKIFKTYHLLTTIAITDLGTNHQWILKVDENLKRNGLLT
jgi:hypothetical protein